MEKTNWFGALDPFYIVRQSMEIHDKKIATVSDALIQLEPDKTLSPELAQESLSIVLDAINSSINGLIISDLTGLIRYANPSFCRMFGYSCNEVIGKEVATLFGTKEVRSLSDVIEIIDINKEETEEFIVQGSDGCRFMVEVSASSVTSQSGQLVGRMASFIDISKRKEIEIDRERIILKLQDALDHIKTLRGIIPICTCCKEIRDEEGSWHKVEKYVRDHSEAEFSHGLCPKCYQKEMERIDEYKRKE